MRKFILPLFFLFLTIVVILAILFRGIAKKISIPHGSSANLISVGEHFDNKTSINVLLLGYGGGNHDGAYLTDSMMVVHINPKTQKIFLISIPRDIWIKIPTDEQTSSYWKINAAYELGLDDKDYPNKKPQFKGADGGGRMAEYIVSQATGLPIDYFVGMDFTGFTHSINTIGGVDINVQPGFDDYSYPIEGKEDDPCGLLDTQISSLSAQIATGSATESDSFPCRFEHLHFDSGLQHMDGERALTYVRSRHSLQDGTDFGRSKRQRNLLVAVKQKVFSIGFIPQAFPFISSLGNDLRTDLSVNDLQTFIQNASDLNKYQIVDLALTDKNFLKDAVSSDGQDILEPSDGLDNWTSVHNWLADELSGKLEPITAVVQIENGTTIPGLAQLAVNRLKNQNIQALDPIDAQNHEMQTTTIAVSNNHINQSDLTTIENEFSISKVSSQNSTQSKYNVLIIVGKDYNAKEGKKVLNEP